MEKDIVFLSRMFFVFGDMFFFFFWAKGQAFVWTLDIIICYTKHCHYASFLRITTLALTDIIIDGGKFILLHILHCFFSKCLLLLLLLLLLPISSLLPLLLVLLLQQHLQQLSNLCFHVTFFKKNRLIYCFDFNFFPNSRVSLRPLPLPLATAPRTLTGVPSQSCSPNRPWNSRRGRGCCTRQTARWVGIKLKNIYLRKSQAETNFNPASCSITRFTSVWYSSEP